MRAASSCERSGISVPNLHGYKNSGDAMRICTCRAPPSLISLIRLAHVVPRTIESSTSTTSLPSTASRSALSLIDTASYRIASVLRINVLPTYVRPLALGKRGNSYFFASETAVFDVIRAEKLCDVLPGELIKIDDTGVLVRATAIMFMTISACDDD